MSLHLNHLAGKYGKEDKMTFKLVDEELKVWKPLQTKWALPRKPHLRQDPMFKQK